MRSPFLILCGTFHHVTLWRLKQTVHTGSSDSYSWTCSDPVCTMALALDSSPCLQPFPAFIADFNKRLLKSVCLASENLNQSNFCYGTSDKNAVQPWWKPDQALHGESQNRSDRKLTGKLSSYCVCLCASSACIMQISHVDFSPARQQIFIEGYTGSISWSFPSVIMKHCLAQTVVCSCWQQALYQRLKIETHWRLC